MNEPTNPRPHHVMHWCKKCGATFYLYLTEEEWAATLPKRRLYAICNDCLRKQAGPLMKTFIDKLKPGY